MNVLSLFTGAGGGELAFQHLLTGFRTIGYVEYEDYCQRTIRQRVKDGLLDAAPIFGDIRLFIENGYARAYQGMVDVITAGFPCQPFSVAGKRKGAQDERNLWPETWDTIRIIRPRFAFLENVSGLLASGYMPQIFSDLAEIGYDARWFVLGADDIGANHRRKRLWIVAYSDKRRSQPGNDHAGREAGSRIVGRCARADVADAKSQNEPGKIRGGRSGDEGGEVSDTILKHDDRCRHESGEICRDRQKPPGLQRGGNWLVEPALGRVAHGVAHRVDRLKAIGNGQVPQVAKVAWEILKPF